MKKEPPLSWSQSGKAGAFLFGSSLANCSEQLSSLPRRILRALFVMEDWGDLTSILVGERDGEGFKA